MISVSYLKECVEYDPCTGLFTWKARPEGHFRPGRYGSATVCAAWNKKYAGKPALHHNTGRGYLSGAINGRHYFAHRAAYAIATGEWPSWTVDHINGVTSDNRICNLREATPAQQMLNVETKRGRVRGVSQHKRRGAVRYSASIRVHLGYFDTEAEAEKAYESAAKKVHDRAFYLKNGLRLV